MRRFVLGLGVGSVLLVAGCSDDTTPNGGTAGATTAGSGGSVAGGGNGGATTAGSTSGGSGGTAGMAGGAGGGGAGGTAGASGGGAGGAGGTGGSAGSGGAGGAGACTPVAGPGAGKMYTTNGWKAAWNVPCDFEMHGGCADAMPPEKAFDGTGDTRTSIGNTHVEAEPPTTAQVIGDSFTFDMMSCNKISKMVMWASTPPNNQGKYDPRDFPGEVKVTVSSDCKTEGTNITGTFGAVVATGKEPQPGCQGDQCTMPMTITIDPPVPAKCVKLELTKILQLGGGIWWAMTELQVFE